MIDKHKDSVDLDAWTMVNKKILTSTMSSREIPFLGGEVHGDLRGKLDRPDPLGIKADEECRRYVSTDEAIQAAIADADWVGILQAFSGAVFAHEGDEVEKPYSHEGDIDDKGNSGESLSNSAVLGPKKLEGVSTHVSQAPGGFLDFGGEESKRWSSGHAEPGVEGGVEGGHEMSNAEGGGGAGERLAGAALAELRLAGPYCALTFSVRSRAYYMVDRPCRLKKMIKSRIWSLWLHRIINVKRGGLH